jgi:DNA-binding response OmpR family regulator
MTWLAEPKPIALVGCDKVQAVLLTERLRSMGHASTSFESGADFLVALGSGTKFGMLLLTLRGEGGWAGLVAMCKVLHIPALLVIDESQRHLPVDELVTVRDETSRSPAIDFIVWPINDLELDWRMRALIRRVDVPAQPQPRTVDLVFDGYHFLGPNRVIVHEDREVRLKPREFELALLLFRNSGRLLERDWILSLLWGTEVSRKDSRVLDVCMSGIRRKLSLCRENGFILHTVYGRGYELGRMPIPSERQVQGIESFGGLRAAEVHAAAA